MGNGNVVGLVLKAGEVESQVDRAPNQEETSEILKFPATAEEVKIEKIKEATDAVQEHLDKTAAAQGYDNINTIAKYIGYPNSFESECIALGTWCSACWDYCFDALAKIEAGIREEPTTEELIAELPVYGE